MRNETLNAQVGLDRAVTDDAHQARATRLGDTARQHRMETTVASDIAVGDLVQASGHAGPFKVLEIRQGLALLEHDDGHRLSVRTTVVKVVRKGEPVAPPAASETVTDDAPSLFDEG